MVRVNKTVRLAYETKLWIDELINIKELELREEINKGIVSKLEEDLFSINSEILVASRIMCKWKIHSVNYN